MVSGMALMNIGTSLDPLPPLPPDPVEPDAVRPCRHCGGDAALLARPTLAPCGIDSRSVPPVQRYRVVSYRYWCDGCCEVTKGRSDV